MAANFHRQMPRAAGILLHPSSLPGDYGNGDLGQGAYAFIDWLVTAKASLWQILPLVPTDDNGSPYSSWSALAGNPDLIDIAGLVKLGLLEPAEIAAFDLPTAANTNCNDIRRARQPLLDKAVARFLADQKSDFYKNFCDFVNHSAWVQDTALFCALKQIYQSAWWDWPEDLRDRQTEALAKARQELSNSIDAAMALQFLFEHQWQSLRRYANERGIKIVGDIPIYVAADSADVWANRELFELNKEGTPIRVAGVPPDAFSDTGQRWGNPLYRWDKMATDGYSWWRMRVARSLELTDWVRIDHFRGLAAYWAIPESSPDARQGDWLIGPGEALFVALREVAPDLPIIAEDLGEIDDSVRSFLKSLGLPGMLVLHFAFGSDAKNLYLPHNHTTNSVVYTGTHDNDTTLGFWQSTSEHSRDHIRHYFGVDGHDIVWDLIRAALASVARFAVIPMQDVLQLGHEARMNTPGVISGNWQWRMDSQALQPYIAERFALLVELYNRIS
ncbi:MAG: 4-alpha-glucanotransferase [Deltaproteobacteria bacterium]|nr:4-alpha-glucanotransferase [Deltaproteobacteria bacterium]